MKSVKDRVDKTTSEVKSTIEKLQPATHQEDAGNPNNPNHPDNIGKKSKINPIEVKLTGIELPFWDMVIFMVTAAIAAIPAIIILFLIGTAIMVAIGGLTGR